MSLKGVHLVFIIASIALTAMMAVWGVGMYTSGRGAAGHLAFAAVSVLSGAALVVYAVKFVRKARQIGLH
jgi:hypothetical protein